MKLQETKEKVTTDDLTGKKVNGKVVTKETPNEVWDDDFNIKLDFHGIKSLRGAPKEVHGHFRVVHQELTTLEFSPQVVWGYYSVFANRLTSLKGAPKQVGCDGAKDPNSQYEFSCSKNRSLSSFEGAPERIGGNLAARGCAFTNLHDIHKHVKEIGVRTGHGIVKVYNNPIKSHVLGVLYIKGCKEIELITNDSNENVDDLAILKKVQVILNKYLSQTHGHKEILECKFELQDAGLDEFAKL
jgi:hypothetical protein